MLILSRRPGDAVLIDGGIRVVVLASNGGTVRLGIEAPDSVGIVREEIVLEVAEENRRATAADTARAWAEKLPVKPVEQDASGCAASGRVPRDGA